MQSCKKVTEFWFVTYLREMDLENCAHTGRRISLLWFDRMKKCQCMWFVKKKAATRGYFTETSYYLAHFFLLRNILAPRTTGSINSIPRQMLKKTLMQMVTRGRFLKISINLILD
mgnify:CR=1 FL=1